MAIQVDFLLLKKQHLHGTIIFLRRQPETVWWRSGKIDGKKTIKIHNRNEPKD